MPEQALNAEEVVSAALVLLDEVGLGGFTMRALSERLGTYPATIYWHVGSRGDVLSAIGARVLEEVFRDLPGPVSAPWDEWLVETARAYRRVMRAHPAMAGWAVTHFEAQVPVPDALEQIISVLCRAGFSGKRLVGAYNAYMGSLLGWVGLELIADDPDLGSDPERMEASVLGLSGEEYPTIVANRFEFANRALGFRWQGGVTNPLDEGFEFALATWIEGLRRLASPDGRHSATGGVH